MSDLAGDFFLDPSVPIVSPAALSALGASLPHTRLKRILTLLEGKLLRCREVGLTKDSPGGEFRAANVEAVLGGEVVVLEGEASLAVPTNHPTVYLVSQAAIEPLDPSAPAGMRVRVVRGQLATQPGDGPALCLARLNWSDDAVFPNRRKGTLDPFWWPDVMRVASDRRSLEAAALLDGLLPDAPASLIRLLASAQRGEVGWPALLSELFRYAECRWQDDPDRRTALRAAARLPENACAVAELVRLLHEENGSMLVPWFRHEGRQYHRLRILKPLEVNTHDLKEQVKTKAEFARAEQSGALALAIGGSAETYYDVTLRAGSKVLSFTRQGGQGIEYLTTVQEGECLCLTLHRYGDELPPWALGLYKCQVSD